MRYFSYIAEQSFKTSPTGERLFFLGGPWSRPFIIPDAETEQKVFKKQLWLTRVFFGLLILGQPFLFQIFPEIIKDATAFSAYCILNIAIWYAIGRLVFHSEIVNLTRSESRMLLKAYFGAHAARSSVLTLTLGVMACTLFVACGIWMFYTEETPIIALLCIVFFGLCDLAWAYSLYLKIKSADRI